jgi:hypothetical protein
MSDDHKPSDATSDGSGGPSELSQREENAALRDFVDAIPNLVFCLDREYRIVDVNHHVPGVSRDSFIGVSAVASMLPEERDAVLSRWDRVLASGEVLVYETSGAGPNRDARLFAEEARCILPQPAVLTVPALARIGVPASPSVAGSCDAAEASLGGDANHVRQMPRRPSTGGATKWSDARASSRTSARRSSSG